MKFYKGDEVKLVHGICEMEKNLIKQGNIDFIVERIDKTHGYIVVRDSVGLWHLHPEALVLIERKQK